MSSTIHYTTCPVCGSSEIRNILSSKDYTSSGETFVIAECALCSLRFTQDVPDANSISRYYKSEEYISHTNTSKGLINRLYKFVRKRTMVKKRRLIEKSTGMKKSQLLDIGSGVGTFVNEMNQHGWKVKGVEPEAEAREAAKKLYGIELNDILELDKLPESSFDAITLWHVLEHVHDLQAYMRQLKVLLNEKGRLFIAVPNYTSKDQVIYKEYWAAYDVPRHLYHFSPKAMNVLIEKNGLRLLKYKPMWFDSFYVCLLSSKYQNGRTNYLAALLNGIRSNFMAFMDVKNCSSVIYIISK